MARAEFNFDDLNTWINNIKNEAAETASEEIIKKLQIEGPYWTGEFAGAWEARLGKTTIPADQKSTIREGFSIPEARPRQMEAYSVQAAPKGGNKKVEYTIDNRMEYRNVAKDLIPARADGRYRGDMPNATARKDWYTRYLQGGGLAQTLALATDRVSKDPKIKNYKGDLNR